MFNRLKFKLQNKRKQCKFCKKTFYDFKIIIYGGCQEYSSETKQLLCPYCKRDIEYRGYIVV